MNLITNKKIKKILYILLIITILGLFVIPTSTSGVIITPNGMQQIQKDLGFSSNTDESRGGKLFRPIAQLLAFVADLSIELAQQFLWDGSTINEKNEYHIYIGPATIFTGKIPRIRC